MGTIPTPMMIEAEEARDCAQCTDPIARGVVMVRAETDDLHTGRWNERVRTRHYAHRSQPDPRPGEARA